MDRQAILDCMANHVRGADRADRALFLSTFHPDAVADIGEFVGGPEALFDWSQDVRSAQRSHHRQILNHTCEIDGDVAHAETYYQYVSTNDDGTNAVMGGRFIDRFERRGGEWKIAVRQNLIEWAGILPALALPFQDVADLHLNGAPSRSKADPSYQRPLVNRRPIREP
jgi:ketosteroid isomerase-like protein